MSKATPSPTARAENASESSSDVARRTVLAGAAWAVPAIALTSSTPAFATTSDIDLALAPSSPSVPAAGAAQWTATATRGGTPTAGRAVTFTGPSGSTVSPSSATTDGAGKASTQVNLSTPWLRPGSTTSVSASSGSASASATASVVGSNVVAFGKLYSVSPAQSELVFPSPVVRAVSGDSGSSDTGFGLVLLLDGTVWAKGSNASGQLGDGTTTARSTWAPVSGLSGVTQIAAGYSCGFALLSDKTVRAWGENSSGQLGDGTSVSKSTPVAVSSLSGVTDIAAAGTAGYALLSDGSLRAWGHNGWGQLGDGTTTWRNTPVTVTGVSGVKQIVGGARSGYALLSDGSLRAWGNNEYGQVGDGTTTNRPTAVAVAGVSGATQIAACGGSAYAILTNGSVRSWGRNSSGELGDGTTTNRSNAVSVSGLGATALQIAGTGAASVCVLLSNGSVKSWGWNDRGQLGDGTQTDRSTPVTVLVPSGQTIQRLTQNSPSAGATLLITGPRLSMTAASPVTAGSSGSAVTVTTRDGSNALANQAVSIKISSGGALAASSGSTDSNGLFSTTLSVPSTWTAPGSLLYLTADSGSSTTTAATSVVGSNVVAMGVSYSSTPAQSELVFPSPVVRAVSGRTSSDSGFALVLLQDGSVWAKGSNGSGQLGDGTTTSRSTWAAVSGLSAATQIAAGYNTGYALLSDGTVRAWGSNVNGQVGDGTTTARTTPVAVSTLSGVTNIAAGGGAGFALLSDGSLRAWGNNVYGTLGDGTTTSRTTPVAVPGVSGVKQIVVGGTSGYALLSNGTVRAWGDNSSGQLGDGTTTNRTTAVAVSGLSGVTGLGAAGASAYAIVADGSVRSWGLNGYGQLGDGTTTNRSTAVSVSGLGAKALQIAGIGYGAVYVLLADGSVKAWGDNGGGQLGDGTQTSRPTPVTVLVPSGHTVQRLAQNVSSTGPTLLVMTV